MTTISFGVQKHRWRPVGDALAGVQQCAVCNIRRRFLWRDNKRIAAQLRGERVKAWLYSADRGKTEASKPIACPEWWGGPLKRYNEAGELVTDTPDPAVKAIVASLRAAASGDA